MIHYLKPLQPVHNSIVREIYMDAIENLDDVLYTDQQIKAWSSLAFLPSVLDDVLSSGKGWISLQNKEIAAFAVRYPLDRLALLYCRSNFSRQGHATSLIKQIEQEAFREGQYLLKTEASFLSFPLLMKLGWSLVRPEYIEIGGVEFKRFLMQKNFTS